MMGTACRAAVALGLIGLLTGSASSASPPSPRSVPGAALYCRALREPRVLYLAESGERQVLAERLSHKVPAEVTFALLNYTDMQQHHLCDKPLEEPKEDVAYMAEEGRKFVEACLGDLKRFDVVIGQFQPRSNDAAAQARSVEIQERLVAYVRGGGRLVFINPSWETTFEGTPLAEVLPVRTGKGKAWSFACEGATDHPLSRGLPLEALGTWWYGPVYEAADETCEPLTRNPPAEQARFWHRRIPGGGQVVHLFSVYGARPQWASTSYATYEPQRPDDTAAWDAFFRRLLYGLAYGDQAFPALVKIALPEKAVCRFGERLAVPVDVENRSGFEQTLGVSVEVAVRRSARAVVARAEVALKAGERRTVPLEVLVDLPCVDPYVAIRARAGDAAGRTVFCESTAWAPYVHRLPVSVATDKVSCAPGAAFEATLAWDGSGQAGDYAAALYLVDHAGRVMGRAEGKIAAVGGAGGSWAARFTMPDGGPEAVSCYWVAAMVRHGEATAGTAWVQVQLDQPWDMRRQFQWSVWSGGGDGQYMTLLRDAGFNTFGFTGNHALADRYAMRQYVEGTGVDTFGVKIEKESWAAVRQFIEAGFDRLNKDGPDARSKAIVSLGEESGFGWGWGARYYWKDEHAERAPPVAQKAFDEYLEGQYQGDLAALNREWGTAYGAFSEIPLESAKVRSPGQVFVEAAAWEAMQKQDAKAEALPVELKAVDPARRYLAHSAPYYETYRFFDWYYQKYCDLVTEAYRARRNPAPLTIISAPGGFYPKVDVYGFNGVGPFYPKEAALVGNAIARKDYGDVPGVSATMWAYFDLRSLWEATVLSSLAAGNSHIGFWVDVPLTFNADLTHTRATFWTKLLTSRVRPIEPILLHKRFAYTEGLGLFVGEQPIPKGLTGKHFGSAISPHAPVYSAMEESGYMPRVVGAADLAGLRALVVSHAQVVSPDEGRRLAAFVRDGGTLICTPWLACCSPHGNLLSVYPAEETGLADLLGFRLLNTSQEVRKQEVSADLGAHFADLPRPLVLTSKGCDGVRDVAADVEVLARYADGTPLLLRRAVGRGNVVYLNMIYDWDGWWNAFHEPGREAYRKLVTAILRDVGRVNAEYFLAFESAEAVDDNKGWWGLQMKSVPQPGESVPWWAGQLYADPGGEVRYLAVFTDHRSPKVTARLHWNGPAVRVFDLLGGEEVEAEQGALRMALRPGQAALWALVPNVPKRIEVEAPRRVRAGETLRVGVRIPDLEKTPTVSGVAIEVTDPFGRASRFHTLRSVDVAGGRAEVAIPTAANDPAGEYRVTATESLTRLRAEKTFTLEPGTAAPGAATLSPFPPTSAGRWPAKAMTSAQFLDTLRALRAVYLGTHPGLEAKYMLSYYLNVPFRPGNRHALVRRLQRTDWGPHLAALAEALRAGETFYLLGEDLNVDPVTKRSIDPLAATDIAAAVERLAKIRGAARRKTEAQGFAFDVIALGRGALVTGEASVDRAAYLSSDFAAWHEKIRKALRVAGGAETAAATVSNDP